MRARLAKPPLVVAAAVALVGATEPRRSGSSSSRRQHRRAEQRLEPRAAAGRAASRVVHTINKLAASVRKTRYQARTVVRRKAGYYAWDCSGMAAWILRRTAPGALRALNRRRPLARDFYHAIRRAPTKRGRRGWQRLAHISQARPGDLFAWLRSPLSRSKVTGHVGFIVDRPTPIPGKPRLYLARILDATSLPHQDDTRAADSGGGFGFGTVLFVTNKAGRTIAYGWYGTESLRWGVLPARTLFGRVVR